MCSVNEDVLLGFSARRSGIIINANLLASASIRTAEAAPTRRARRADRRKASDGVSGVTLFCHAPCDPLFYPPLYSFFFFSLGLGAEGRLKNRFDFAERAPCQSMYVLCFSRRCRWRSCGIIESPGFVVLPGRVEDRCCVLHRRWLGWRLDPEVSVPVPTTGREFAAKLFIAPCARSPCF